MDESQQRSGAQYVGARKGGGRLERRLLVQGGERGGLARLGVIAQDCHRLGQRRRVGRQAVKAKRDRPRTGPRRELAKPRNVFGGRAQSLVCDHADELRRSSGLPAVSSQQAQQNASSASGDTPVRSRAVAAPALSGAGRTTVASGSETVCASRAGSSARSCGRRPTTTTTSRASMRGSRYASQRIEG